MMHYCPEEKLKWLRPICEEHPELCPHNMKWVTAVESNESDIRETKYRCSLCGKEVIVIDNKYAELRKELDLNEPDEFGKWKILEFFFHRRNKI